MIALVCSICFLATLPVAADNGRPLEWDATIAGVDLRTLDASTAFELGSADEQPTVLTIRNNGSEPVTVQSIRLQGRVMGMAFVSFTTRLGITLAPGESTERRFPMYFEDVGDQARGLIPARLILRGPEGVVLDSIEFPLHIDGSRLSVYSVFGMAVAGATLAMLATLFLAIRSGRLPENRWRRALWFLPCGTGIGLSLTFTLSSLSLLTPRAGSWITLVLLCGGAAFLVGYFWILGLSVEEEEGEIEVGDGEGSAGATDEEFVGAGDTEQFGDGYSDVRRVAP